MQIQRKHIGVIIFALLMIERCIRHMWYMRSFLGYRHIFIDYLPEYSIILRYLFSLSLRIAGIFISVGSLFFKARYRMALICFSWFNILTIYWKHPYQAVYKHAFSSWEQFPFPGKFFMTLDLTQEQLTWLWIGFFDFVEVTFNALLIFYLTRPKVKKLFH